MLSTISKHDVAYFLGFMAGDGGYEGGKNRKPRLTVYTTDSDIVEWINNHIIDFPLRNGFMYNNPSKNIKATRLCYKRTFPVSFSEDFNKYGILDKKINRKITNIKRQYFAYFLLGLFDADGSISFGKRKDRDRLWGHIAFTHPSINLLEQIQNYIEQVLNIPSKIRPKGNDECYVLTISKLDNIKNFLEHIYLNGYVLERKYRKSQEFIKTLEKFKDTGKCYPSEFTKSKEFIAIIGSKTKWTPIVNGTRYINFVEVALDYNITSKLAASRCRQGNKGFTRELKTKEEMIIQENWINDQIKQLFAEYSTNAT